MKRFLLFSFLTLLVSSPAALAAPPHEEAPTDDNIYEVVEEMPLFSDGDSYDFSRWVMSRMVYPAKAQEEGIQGRVIVSFVVEKCGSVGDVVIVHSPDPSLSEVVLNIVKSSPKWTSGMQNGKPVKVKYTLPVMFRLQE